jgi:hypothetical protein
LYSVIIPFPNLGPCLARVSHVTASLTLLGICAAGVCFLLVFLRAVVEETRPRVRDTPKLTSRWKQIDISSVAIQHHSKHADRAA